MSRRFVIFECSEHATVSTLAMSISESELRRRIIIINKLDTCVEEDMRKGVEIILHGDWKEAVDPFSWWCETCHRRVQNEDVTYEETHDPRCGGCGNAVIPYSDVVETDDKPSHAPTEWELWCKDLAHALTEKIYQSYETQSVDVERILLRMPRGK